MTNQTVHLQYVGEVPGIPASEIKSGDVRMYNYGSTALVLKVIEKSPKTLTIITFESGKYYMSDIRKTTLVAIVEHNQNISEHNPQQAYNVSGRNKGMVDVSEHFQQVEETATETTSTNPQQTASPYNHLIGSRVLGNWGMAGIDYGTIKDVHTDSYGTDIIIKWEDSEELDESREDLKGTSIINDSTDINAIGIYIDTVGTYLSHPRQSAEQGSEVIQEPTQSNKPNNVISLADRRAKKQQQAEEKQQLEQAETFFLQEVLPYMTQEEKQQVLNIADDPKKFSSFMLEVALKCKIRQNE